MSEKAFAQFREMVLDDERLQARLRDIMERSEFITTVVAAAGEAGYEITAEDVEFAEVAIRAAVAAIRRAQALETTRADNRRLEALATTDPLTRVLNRRALIDRLSAEVDRARRYSSGLTMLLLDVDYFKQINDTAGHLAGDSVLRQLGALLEDAMRKVDVVARYGGEEFVAILPETSAEGGVAFAERLRERIEGQEFTVNNGLTVHLTVTDCPLVEGSGLSSVMVVVVLALFTVWAVTGDEALPL